MDGFDPSAVLEQPIVRAGAVAAALVAVGQVLKWIHVRIKKFYGVDRVGELSRKLDDLDGKVDEIRNEAIAVAADTNERVARMEGQIDTILSILGHKATTHKSA